MTPPKDSKHMVSQRLTVHCKLPEPIISEIKTHVKSVNAGDGNGSKSERTNESTETVPKANEAILEI